MTFQSLWSQNRKHFEVKGCYLCVAIGTSKLKIQNPWNPCESKSLSTAHDFMLLPIDFCINSRLNWKLNFHQHSHCNFQITFLRRCIPAAGDECKKKLRLKGKFTKALKRISIESQITCNYSNAHRRDRRQSDCVSSNHGAAPEEFFIPRVFHRIFRVQWRKSFSDLLRISRDNFILDETILDFAKALDVFLTAYDISLMSLIYSTFSAVGRRLSFNFYRLGLSCLWRRNLP